MLNHFQSWETCELKCVGCFFKVILRYLQVSHETWSKYLRKSVDFFGHYEFSSPFGWKNKNQMDENVCLLLMPFSSGCSDMNFDGISAIFVTLLGANWFCCSFNFGMNGFTCRATTLHMFQFELMRNVPIICNLSQEIDVALQRKLRRCLCIVHV